MSRSRLIPVALVVTLLLAVVAIAARGRPLGSRGGSGGALPFSFWDYTYTTIIIVFVPLFLAGFFAAAFIRRSQARKRQSTLGGLFQQLLLFSLLVALWLLVIRRHVHLHTTPPEPIGSPKPGQGGGGAGGKRSLQFRWDEFLILLGVLVVTGAVIAARFYRPGQRLPGQAAPETEALAAALDESIDDLHSDPDLRRAIIAAYARMETALAAAGVPRDPAEAPLEYLERVLLSLHIDEDAVRRLTDLFEWARFSHHEPEPAMRDDAVDALVAVRDELRASELVPA